MRLANAILPFVWKTLPFGILSYIMIKAKHPHIHCNFGTRLALFNLDKYHFGNGVKLNEISAWPGLTVGEHSMISEGALLACTPEHPIKIGKRTTFGQNVFVATLDHPINTPTTSFHVFGDNAGPPDPEFEAQKRRGAVTIGNDVWVGIRVAILRGVTIGDGAVIGANSVVTKDVEPYTIVGGVPAKLIRRRFSESVAKQLQEIKWWDWPDERIRRNRKFLSTNLNEYKGDVRDLIAD
jgi:acetyltransferase-like isoleucine patch superfamily enzyme